ncbi:MAG TPA: hypothetical protein VGM53_35400 [Streptosporangiaceae bacterium]
MARTRAGGAESSSPRPGQPVTHGVRSALETARQRWASRPVPEAPGPAAGDPAGAGTGAGTDIAVAQPGWGPSNSWAGTSGPLRQTWARYADRGQRIGAAVPLLAVPYWLVWGGPGFAVHCLLRWGQDATDRPAGAAGLAAGLLVLIAGLWIAGVI